MNIIEKAFKNMIKLDTEFSEKNQDIDKIIELFYSSFKSEYLKIEKQIELSMSILLYYLRINLSKLSGSDFLPVLKD